MACFWGNTWFQVIHNDLKLCGILMLSKYPTAEGGVDAKGNENVKVILPDLPDGSGFQLIEHSTEQEARLACKHHVVSRSRNDLLSCLWVINDTECDLDEHRIVIKSPIEDKDYYQRKIINCKNTILDFKGKVKELKQLRKARTKEFLESELISIARNLTSSN